MELRHLRYFVLVAEELHFGRAAARAGIAQPPLSQQIRSLEAELGVTLFYRTRRSVRLSEAGSALLPEAKRLLSDAERAREIARAAEAGRLGTLRLGFVGSLAFGWLPQFTRAMHVANPSVHLELCELTSEQQRIALRDDRIDLGVSRYPLAEPGVTSELIAGERLILAVPDDHRFAGDESPVQTRDLDGEDIIIFPREQGPPFFDQIMGLLRNSSAEPVIAQEAIQMSTILGLVSAGAGVAIVPESMSRLHLDGLAFRELRDAEGVSPMASVYLGVRDDERREMVWNARVVALAGNAAD